MKDYMQELFEIPLKEYATTKNIVISDPESQEKIIEMLEAIIKAQGESKTTNEVFRSKEVAELLKAIREIYLPVSIYIKNIEAIKITKGMVNSLTNGWAGTEKLKTTIQNVVEKAKQELTKEKINFATKTMKMTKPNDDAVLISLEELEENHKEIYQQLIQCVGEKYEFEKQSELSFYKTKIYPITENEKEIYKVQEEDQPSEDGFKEYCLTEEEMAIYQAQEEYKKIYFAKKLLTKLEITKDLDAQRQTEIIETLGQKKELYEEGKKSFSVPSMRSDIKTRKELIELKRKALKEARNKIQLNNGDEAPRGKITQLETGLNQEKTENERLKNFLLANGINFEDKKESSDTFPGFFKPFKELWNHFSGEFERTETNIPEKK